MIQWRELRLIILICIMMLGSIGFAVWAKFQTTTPQVAGISIHGQDVVTATPAPTVDSSPQTEPEPVEYTANPTLTITPPSTSVFAPTPVPSPEPLQLFNAFPNFRI